MSNLNVYKEPRYALEKLDKHFDNNINATTISVVVPLYKEERNVEPLTHRLAEVFHRLDVDWELVFALDPSPDATFQRIKSLILDGYPIRLITFSRRIGKPLSLLAGLDHIQGDACVVIDADLQDPPEVIAELVRKWREGYDVVIAQRKSRKGEHFLYLKSAELFYWLFGKISEVKIPENTGDFRLMDAKIVQKVCEHRERHAFLRGLVALVGYKTATVPYDRDPRLTGKTQISLWGALNIALDGIIPFSRVPVRMISVLGIVLVLSGVTIGTGLTVAGMVGSFSSAKLFGLSTAFSAIFTGIITISLGIVGEYLVRNYEETRNRPLYIIDELIESESLKKKLQASECNRRASV